MSTQEIKNMLHESIENINDNDLLLTIKEMLESKYSGRKIRLSAARLKKIDEAKRQIAQGKILSNAQADKIIDKWLNA